MAGTYVMSERKEKYGKGFGGKPVGRGNLMKRSRWEIDVKGPIHSKLNCAV
jgi:hypothetical protein